MMITTNRRLTLNHLTIIRRTIGISLTFAITLLPMAPVSAQDSIPRSVLINMVKGQYEVLCNSQVFTQCLGFSQPQCTALSDKAIEQCLMPLPETINPAELSNDSLEACPLAIFEEAGFTQDKANACFDKAAKPKQ